MWGNKNELSGARKEVTRSYYDATNTAINGNGLSAVHSLETTTQRKRIVHVTYEENFDNNDATYDHASHYDYDIHGNVKTLLQDNRKLGAISDIAQHRIKRFDYSYDLISGNVHRVDYQTGKADQWHHAYTYDADNRIVEAYTTTATPVASALSGSAAMAIEAQNSPHWDREAAYAYYDHGPLARTVLGEHEVQGIDNVYTLQGWIKGVNSNVLGSSNDLGKDGAAGPNAQVAVDAFSYSLHYFNGDYLSIGTQSANFIATQAAGSNLGQLKKDLYNGNIGAMVTTITHPTTRAILPLGNVYEYDQLNRLATARSFDNLNLNTNSWGSAGAEKYYNAFTYDANGNILSQVRKDQNNNTIDNLTYNYHKNSSGKTVRNRLYSVDDAIANGTFTDDIDDMPLFVPDGNINIDNNYSYDAEGRLIKDVQEGITNIVWRVDSKVKTIYKLGASTPKIISFDYDAMGHRVAKHVYNGSGTLERSTYYTLDAQGNAMVVYEREVNASNQTITFTVEEKMIYGSTRLGVLNDSLPMLGTQNNTYNQKLWSHVVGKRTYELANHLGNVLSVISDKPIPHDNGNGTADYFMADIRQAQDYSPFGVTLYGRNFTASGADGFRFGFQGQEMDDEIKGKGNSVNYTFRMHDPRIGRFFAIDPLTKEYPWYTPYQFSGNKVIQCIELEGLEEYIVNVTIEQISEQIFNPELEKTFATPGIKIKVTLTYVKSSERHPLKDDKGDEIKGSENREVDVYIGGVMLENHKIPSNSIYAILRDQKFKTSNESGGSVDMRTLKEAMESGNNVKKIYEGPQGKMMDRLVANFDEHTIFQVSIFYGSDKSVNSGNNEAKEIENLTKLMIQYPFLKLSIEASTDRVGSEADNMKLSTSRATNIMTGVLNLGKGQINKDRITAKGLGEQPAINRKDPDGSENPVLRRTKITPKI